MMMFTASSGYCCWSLRGHKPKSHCMRLGAAPAAPGTPQPRPRAPAPASPQHLPPPRARPPPPRGGPPRPGAALAPLTLAATGPAAAPSPSPAAARGARSRPPWPRRCGAAAAPPARPAGHGAALRRREGSRGGSQPQGSSSRVPVLLEVERFQSASARTCSGDLGSISQIPLRHPKCYCGRGKNRKTRFTCSGETAGGYPDLFLPL